MVNQRVPKFTVKKRGYDTTSHGKLGRCGQKSACIFQLAQGSKTSAAATHYDLALWEKVNPPLLKPSPNQQTLMCWIFFCWKCPTTSIKTSWNRSSKILQDVKKVIAGANAFVVISANTSTACTKPSSTWRTTSLSSESISKGHQTTLHRTLGSSHAVQCCSS